MAEPDARRGPSANTRRAQRLLMAGVAGGHAALLACVVAFALAGGWPGALSAAIAGVVTIAFFTIGQAVQVVVADAPARRILIASLASYVLRVTVLGLLLALALDNADWVAWLDPVAVAATTIAVVIGWLAVELWVYSRMRIPVYDE
jgi:hypothetical protein